MSPVLKVPPKREELRQVPMCGAEPEDEEEKKAWEATAWGCCGRSEAGAQAGKRVWFIHPEGSFRKLWDTIQAFLLIYVAISVPLRLGFGVVNESFGSGWFVELGVDVYFWSDILFNFRTGFFSNDGIVISQRDQIRQAYLKGWFPIDAVSCLPVSYIMLVIGATSGGASGNIKGLRMMRMLRLTKMLRLGRLKRIFSRYAEQMQPYVKAIKLTGMIIVAFFLARKITSKPPQLARFFLTDCLWLQIYSPACGLEWAARWTGW